VTFSHTGTDGEYVIVDATVDRNSALTATYDGVAMKYLGKGFYPGWNSSASLVKFGIPITSANAGTKTVSIANPGGGYIAANSSAYTNVAGVGIPSFTASSGTALSQATTPPTNGRVVQSFGIGGNATNTTISMLSGGITRYAYGGLLPAFSMSDAVATTTFTGTITPTGAWIGGAINLSPTATVAPRLDGSTGAATVLVASGGAKTLTGPVVTAGADVFVDIAVDRAANATVTAVTYDGAAMTLLGSVSYTGNSGNSTLYRYRLTGAPAGAKTISFTLPAPANLYYSVSVVSVVGVVSVNPTTTTSGGGTTPSQAITATTDQVILQTFGLTSALTANSSNTGGAVLWDSAGATLPGATITSIADTSTTFTLSSTNNWGGIATILTIDSSNQGQFFAMFY
jgi:hypothetical protein